MGQGQTCHTAACEVVVAPPPSKEDQWRYCCHLEGDVPIELQLASARTTAKFEAAQRRAQAQRAAELQAATASSLPQQLPWDARDPPKTSQAEPRQPRPSESNFPEVFR